MGHEKKFFYFVAAVIAALFLLELIDFNALFNFNLDFGLVVAVAFIVLGGFAGLTYARTGDWNFFMIAGALILIGLISYFSLFGELTTFMAAAMGWGVIIFLLVWRSSRKNQA